MYWDLILWLFAVISNIVLLVFVICQIKCLSDLEADYSNIYETSGIMDSMFLPEFGLQAAFCASFLLTGHFFMFIVTLPVAIYHARLFNRNEHLLNVTEIFRTLSREKKYRFIKLCLYLLYFLLVTARFVIAIYNSLADEEDALHGFLVF